MLTLALMAILGWGFGWLIRKLTPHLLKMKDRSMPFRWPWVELLSAIFMVMLAMNRPSSDSLLSLWLLKWALFALFLIAISSTDFLTKLIPLTLVWTGTAMGIFFSCIYSKDLLQFQDQAHFVARFMPFHTLSPLQLGLLLSLSGAAMGFLLLELLRRIIGSATRMEVMGMGDSLILMMIGAFIGPKMVLLTLFPASLIGILIGLYFKWVQGLPHSPFGPALAFGGWFQFLFWQRFDAAINQFYGTLYAMPPWVMSMLGFGLLVVLFLLLIRIKKRASYYQQMIDQDYDSISKELED